MKFILILTILLLGRNFSFGQSDSTDIKDTLHVIFPTKKIIKEIKFSNEPDIYELKRLFKQVQSHQFDLYDLLFVINKRGSKIVPVLAKGLFTNDEMRDTINFSANRENISSLSSPFNKAYFLLGLEAIDDSSVYEIIGRAANESNDAEIKAMAIIYLSYQYFNKLKANGKIPNKSIINIFINNLDNIDSSNTYHRNIRDLAVDALENWFGEKDSRLNSMGWFNIRGKGYSNLKNIIAEKYQDIFWNNKRGFFQINN